MSHVRHRESPSKLCLGQRRDLKQKGRRALSFPIRDKRLLSLLEKLFLKKIDIIENSSFISCKKMEQVSHDLLRDREALSCKR